MLSPDAHVVILGAGPAGLTAAHRLSAQGHRAVTVLEADTVVGGLSRTVTYNDYRFDIGGHRFFTKSGEVQALWSELLGADFLRVPRLSRIHYGGRLFDYPLRAGNALRGLGALEALRVMASHLQWRVRPHPVEETFEQWVTNRFGRRLYEIFFKTYTEKVWGLPCTEIRAEWAAQRIEDLSLWRSLVHATGLQRRSQAIKSLVTSFHYPKYGPGQMWEACAAIVAQRGVRVLTGHQVVKIERTRDRIVSVTARTADGERTTRVDHLISTIPIRTLVRTLTPAMSARTREAAEGLRYRDFILVALIINQPSVFPDNWIYVHTPGVQVGRIQNFKNWSAAMVPDTSTTCLGMEYFCSRGDGLWETRDADLIDRASHELAQLGLASREDVSDGVVVRMPKAYPVYDATYRDHLDAVREELDRIQNLQLIGRNGMHKYNNQDHSMLAAIRAVENLRGARHDLWAINTELEYHETQRR